ncbi:tripartite tricarboxylate transporter substrate-binding protein [Pelagibacterium halotolerans]|uniref:tripartite tricarboxylate transporter substrate-binding protein n=1 Tax=Pelagibacterium halotolerans TaxID=531813 RepID=UPI00384EEF4A
MRKANGATATHRRRRYQREGPSMKTNILLPLAASVLALAAAIPAYAEYPEKPVSFVVPFPPGDLEDVLTRMIAEDFQEKYGVAAAVVNKPSEGGPFPGAVDVAVAPADGYTIGSFVMDVPIIGPEVGIPALADSPFEPLGIFLTYPFVIATDADAPYSTMEELADYARENEVSLGHFGSFLVPTQATFAASKIMGFEWGTDASSAALDCNTLASGDFEVINTTIQQIFPCLDQVKILASITQEPLEVVDNVPMLGEVTPRLNLNLWNGLFVHKDTPQDVRDKIIAVAQETMASERAQQLAADTGALIYWMDAEQSVRQIQGDTATLNDINTLIEAH